MARLGMPSAVASLVPAPCWADDAAAPSAVVQDSARRRLLVGPGRPFPNIASVAKAVSNREPTLILLDSGVYRADVAIWQDCDVHIQAAGGPVVLHADGTAAEGKAIWVVRRSRMLVQGITFIGCSVPSGNGAGIRLESGELSVQHCRFTKHQMGLLTGNDGGSRLALWHCEFSHSARDGVAPAHNVYVGRIAHFSMTGCWSHHADIGHLVKSRAAENDIRYSLLADGEGGRSSYELDLPEGGFATVVGNILQQEPATENPHLVSFGVEGTRLPKNELWLMHNTLVDLKREGGLPIKLPNAEREQARGQSGARPQHGLRVEAWDNLLVGFGGQMLNDWPFHEHQGNQRTTVSTSLRGEPWQKTLRTSKSTRTVRLPADMPAGLLPTHQYVHPLKLEPLGVYQQLPGASRVNVDR